MGRLCFFDYPCEGRRLGARHRPLRFDRRWRVGVSTVFRVRLCRDRVEQNAGFLFWMRSYLDRRTLIGPHPSNGTGFQPYGYAPYSPARFGSFLVTS